MRVEDVEMSWDGRRLDPHVERAFECRDVPSCCILVEHVILRNRWMFAEDQTPAVGYGVRGIRTFNIKRVSVYYTRPDYLTLAVAEYFAQTDNVRRERFNLFDDLEYSGSPVCSFIADRTHHQRHVLRHC